MSEGSSSAFLKNCKTLQKKSIFFIRRWVGISLKQLLDHLWTLNSPPNVRQMKCCQISYHFLVQVLKTHTLKLLSNNYTGKIFKSQELKAKISPINRCSPHLKQRVELVKGKCHYQCSAPDTHTVSIFGRMTGIN